MCKYEICHDYYKKSNTDYYKKSNNNTNIIDDRTENKHQMCKYEICND